MELAFMKRMLYLGGKTTIKTGGGTMSGKEFNVFLINHHLTRVNNSDHEMQQKP